MNRKATLWVAVAFVIALLGGAGAGSWLETRSDGTEFIAPVAPAVSNQIKTSYSGTGTFRVPDQFPAGIYYVTAGDMPCHWERLKGMAANSVVLGYGDISRGGYKRLVVNPHDVAVRMVGDCVWTQI